jgi:hypothetical protein
MTLTTSSSPNVLLMEATFDTLLASLRISISYSRSFSTTVHIKHNIHGVLRITRVILQSPAPQNITHSPQPANEN